MNQDSPLSQLAAVLALQEQGPIPDADASLTPNQLQKETIESVFDSLELLIGDCHSGTDLLDHMEYVRDTLLH